MNLPDERGFTALHIAAQKGDTAIVRHLLSSGADLHAETLKHRLKPAYFASSLPVRALFAGPADDLLEAGSMDVETVQQLLNSGLDPNVRDPAHWSPLMSAALHDNEQVIPSPHP